MRSMMRMRARGHGGGARPGVAWGGGVIPPHNPTVFFHSQTTFSPIIYMKPCTIKHKTYNNPILTYCHDAHSQLLHSDTPDP